MATSSPCRPGTISGVIIGREQERRTVDRFLAGIDGPPTVLVIGGDAGMGKTLLWQTAVDAARERGIHVLTARAVERELHLPYAPLADLIGPVFETAGDHLPEPQRRALAAVLLRADPDGPVDIRAVGTAIVGLLERLASAGPVLVAIDDEPWLDPASRPVIAFAARRLPHRVALLLARRSGVEAGPDGVEESLAPEARARIDLGPLSAATLHHLIENDLGVGPARPLLNRIASVSAGNPWFALELGRTAALRNTADTGPSPAPALEPLAVPSTLRDAVARRLANLPIGSRRALTIIAALASPTLDLVESAMTAAADGWTGTREDAPGGGEPPSASDAVVELDRAGLVILEAEEIRIGHPLTAEVVLAGLGDARRHSLHRGLAAIVNDADEAARHLALGVMEPDESVALRIEEAAIRSSRRGARLVSAAMQQAAARLTPADRPADLVRRLIAEGGDRLALGEVGRARELVEQVGALAGEHPEVRPEPDLALLRADIAWADGRLAEAGDRLAEARLDAADPRVRARIGSRLVGLKVSLDPIGVAGVARAILPEIDSDSEPGIAGYVRINRFFAEVAAGGVPDHELLAEGLRLEALGIGRDSISSIPLIWFNGIDDTAAARSRHDFEDAWYRDRGEDGWRAERQAHRAITELRAGAFERAEAEIEASCGRIATFEAQSAWPTPFGWRALIDGHRGRIERARETLGPLIETADARQNHQWAGLLWSVRAFVEFAAGDPAATARAAAEMRARFDGIGFREALGDRSEPFLAEALLELGQVEGATAAIDRLAERGRTVPRPWIHLGLARAQALILAETGHPDEAIERVGAVDPRVAGRLPFDAALNALVHGRLLRRAGHKRDSAARLSGALATFERLGAEPWSRRAREELKRVGLHRGDPFALTPTERRIAELAASGMTNREVAATAFISPKTVEANLARVYGKLGIRSRAELGARMAAETDENHSSQT
jgi:DNA-binding CsgD family transcriptional regulator